jgi:hypothetical protein
MHIAVMDDPATDGQQAFLFRHDRDHARDEPHRAGQLRFDRAQADDACRTKVSDLGMQIFRPDAGSIYDKLGHANHYETKWPDVYRYRYTDLTASLRAAIDRMLELG